MKKFILTTFVCVWANFIFAQQSVKHSATDELFFQGKELFAQQKYSLSQDCFERYLAQKNGDWRAQEQDAEFYLAFTAYLLKQERAGVFLEKFLEKHPYSPHKSSAAFMLGRLNYEKKRYKATLKNYENVDEKELSDKDKREFLFTKAYSLLEEKRLDEAKKIFLSLTKEKNPFGATALYYYSYVEYLQKNNSAALKGFLALEQSGVYDDMVPYYIVQIYYEEGDFEKAISAGERLLEKNPKNANNAEILRIMGECAFSKKQYAATVKFLKEHKALSKKIARSTEYALGVSFFALGDDTKAVESLSKVTSQADSLAQNAYLYLGQIHLRQGDKKRAKLAFEAAAKFDFDKKTQEEALYNFSLISYQTATAFGEGLAAFEKFVAQFPNSKYYDTIYSHITDIFLTNKDYKSAFAALEKMKTLSPEMKKVREFVLFRLGTQAFSKGNLKEAEKQFSAAIDCATSQTSSAEAFLWRGETNYKLENFSAARGDYQQFLNRNKETSPAVAQAHYGVAYAFFAEKKYSDALSWFEKYAEIAQPDEKNATYWDALNRLGDCHFNVRNFEKAQNFYTQVSAKNVKGSDYATFQNAFICGLQKQYTKKIALLKNLLASSPTSEYASNALYEIGRSYVLLEQNEKAISVYSQVVKRYPQNALARRAALEIGMLHFNSSNFEEAKQAYRQVISSYHGSEEARTAFESLESLHVETNDVQAFLEYCKKLGKNYAQNASAGDSLSFVAAERVYIAGKFAEAISSLENYLRQYCSASDERNCIQATYYLADSYYQIGEKKSALPWFEKLTKLEGNKFIETALLRSAEITYDDENFAEALGYFSALKETAANVENRNRARLGMLRCNYLLGNHQQTISSASEILQNASADADLIAEARFNRAKALLALENLTSAQDDLKPLSQNLFSAIGAEAKFLFAETLFAQKDYAGAEAEIFDFIEKNTPYQFWLARSFVLLADIYSAQGDDFQAKQYLLSLRDNYAEKDEIADMISVRLQEIEKRENSLEN